MPSSNPYITKLIDSIIEMLDIPRSYYEKARDRYRSLGNWMHRSESSVRHLSPDVYPQGSFRYGTVIRPLLAGDEYDLDLVCRVDLSKHAVSQEFVKNLIGQEVIAYAKSNSFKEPATEKRRCWRLHYQDEVSFHMDILPSIPQDDYHRELLTESRGVDLELAKYSVAITDNTHRNYEIVHPDWLSSNPRGFAKWFENAARPAVERVLESLVFNHVYASTEEVPPYEWKSPLQRVIQILKRHRDMMFKNNRELAPISMIITTLATHAYGGETNVYTALVNVLNEMPAYVRTSVPRIPNPVNPAEDFADAWQKNPALESNFWAWHAQAKQDISALNEMGLDQVEQLVRRSLGLPLSMGLKATLSTLAAVHAPTIIVKREPTQILQPSKPWKEA